MARNRAQVSIRHTLTGELRTIWSVDWRDYPRDGQWEIMPDSTLSADKAPLDASRAVVIRDISSSYRIIPAGTGWYNVVDLHGTIVNERTLRMASAEELIERLLHGNTD